MALTTLAKVKQYGQITEFESDTLLVRMIDAASAAIENHCSRSFLSAQYTEVRDGTGQRKLTMRNFPITNVASVSVNGQNIPIRLSPLGNGYTYDDHTLKLSGYRFDEGMDNVQVIYTAGLSVVPEDIEIACAEMVMLRYKARDRIGVSSKSLAGETISFTSDDFPDYVTRILDQYNMVGLP